MQKGCLKGTLDLSSDSTSLMGERESTKSVSSAAIGIVNLAPYAEKPPIRESP